MKFLMRNEVETGQIAEWFRPEDDSDENVLDFLVGCAQEFGCEDPCICKQGSGLVGWANWLYTWQLDCLTPLENHGRWVQ